MNEPNVQLVPPHNRSAQQACIGAMIRDNEVIPDVSAQIEADDFYGLADQLVFSAVVGLHREHQPADLVTVATRLHESKRHDGKTDFDEAGGAAYLSNLWDAAPVVGNALAYAAEIRATATMRRLIHAGTEIQRLGYLRDGTTPEELTARAANVIASIQDRQHKDGLVHISVVVDEALQRLDRRRGAAHDGQCENGIDTPWLALNNLIVTLNAGELCIVAARPSVGKTLFVLNLIDHATRMGHKTFFSSIEQGGVDIADRLMSAGSGVNSYCFRSGSFNEAESEAVQHFASVLKGRPLFIDDNSSQSVARIVANASKLKRRDGLDFIVVDYLGLVEPFNRHATLNEKASDVSRGLKQLARQMNVPVLCLCQLNRNSETQGRKPRLSDLRDSGAIEQDADTVMLLHKDAQGEATEEILTVIVAKQRNGPTDTIQLLHQKTNYRIVDLFNGQQA